MEMHCATRVSQSTPNRGQLSPQVWWSLELKALQARFRTAVTRFVTNPGGGALLEVDLSHHIGRLPGSLALVVLIPPTYPSAKPVIMPVDRSGALCSAMTEELGRCACSALDNAVAASGPAIFFAVDQASNMMREAASSIQERIMLRQSQPVTVAAPETLPNTKQISIRGPTETTTAAPAVLSEEKLPAERRLPLNQSARRRQRRRSAAARMAQVTAEAAHEDEHQQVEEQSIAKSQLKGTRSEVSASTPSDISELLDSSDCASSSGDDSVESCSSTDCSDTDGEMASIASMLHQNVRQQLLFKQRRCAATRFSWQKP